MSEKAKSGQKRRVLVVGGGASGLMAAVQAARMGASVTILEQNEKPGKKLAVTGNGRCNFSNLAAPPDAYRGMHPEFVREALADFSVSDTISFFQELGLGVTDKNGYLYPRSGQAASVAEVLCMEARSLGVKIKTNEKVMEIRPRNPGKEARSSCESSALSSCETGSLSWIVTTKTWDYEADAVILAGGSFASAISGSDGSCYALAKALGHRVIEPVPALTALRCKAPGNALALWAGVRTQGMAALFIEGESRYQSSGELQLTDYGVSGIPIFQISRYASRALAEKKKVTLTLNFLPEIGDVRELTAFFADRRRKCPYKNDRELLVGLFPEKLIRVLTAQKSLADAVHAFPLTVTGSLPFAQAQVCAGGVDTEQVNPRTMESLLHPGLYFAGELLDIDGACGGYNLQWAWSSGSCAGRHAADPANRENQAIKKEEHS